MESTQLEELKLEEIIKREPNIISTEFIIWYEDGWVIKKATLINGSHDEMVDIKEVYDIYCKLNQSDSTLLKFPKTYLDKEHAVLIQQRIYGIQLNKANFRDRKLFNQLKKEYENLLLGLRVDPSKNILQFRNIFLDSDNDCWLIDLN